MELKIHTAIEEEIFYPATLDVLPKEGDLLDEARVEHDSAKELIEQIEAGKPGDELWDAKVTVLGEYIKHHVKEEHSEMFPKARKTKLDFKALGEQMRVRKELHCPRSEVQPFATSAISGLHLSDVAICCRLSPLPKSSVQCSASRTMVAQVLR